MIWVRLKIGDTPNGIGKYRNQCVGDQKDIFKSSSNKILSLKKYAL
jgi:hypothetical protein